MGWCERMGGGAAATAAEIAMAAHAEVAADVGQTIKRQRYHLRKNIALDLHRRRNA